MKTADKSHHALSVHLCTCMLLFNDHGGKLQFPCSLQCCRLDQADSTSRIQVYDSLPFRNARNSMSGSDNGGKLS